MSYERDRDAHTRGVGAIAAADGSRTRARQRAQVGRALRERDRALSRITMGPNGGLLGLGAIKGITTAASPVLGRNRTMDASPTTGGRGLTTDYTPPGRPGGVPTPPPRPPTFSVTTASSNVAGGRTVVSGGKTWPGGGGGGAGTNVSPSDGNVDPGLLPTTTISDGSDTTSSGGSSGGGGGGGGGGGAGVTTGGGGGAPTFTDPAVPGEDIPSTGGMSNKTKLLIGAGVLGAAYLLFKKKGS